MSYVAYGTASVCMILLRKPLIGLYTGLSPEAAAITAELILIHMIPGIFIYTLSFFIVSPLRAANDGTYCMCVSILSMAIFRLGMAQILCVQLGWGARGVYCAMVADWICRSICFTIRWYSGAWKKKCGLATPKPAKIKTA